MGSQRERERAVSELMREHARRLVEEIIKKLRKLII